MAVMLQKFVASLLLLLLSIMAASTSPIAKSGCQSQCGNVSIWYPFGIGSADCFYNDWFKILCRQDRPYLSLNQDDVEEYEVLAMTRYGERAIRVYGDTAITIRSNTSNIRFCKDTSDFIGMAANLTGSPFVYSDYNKLMLLGCGTAIAELSNGNHSMVLGCTSSCNGDRFFIEGCSGMLNCCHYAFLYDQSMYYFYYLTELKLSFSKLFTGKNSCGSAFIVDEDWYPINASVFSDPSADLVDVEVPLLLSWQITTWMPGPGFQNNTYCWLYDDVRVPFWRCSCPCGFTGNPYILDGCQDREDDDCSGGLSLMNNLKAIVVGGICLVISVVAATIYMLYMIIRRRIERNHKDKRFKRNGGLLLQKYLSSNENIMEKVRVFTGKDLNKATDNFNENRVLGRGGQGTVYKGMLHDGKIVAIKKSKLLVNENQVEEFINEIIILSQIDHRNVVKLFGCCLEMDVPLLVYEFIPNNLYNLIHSENTHYPLSWELRLRIALEVAEALAYLHSATSIPIYHRDIKSSNILLDEKFKAKVADFGISRNIGIDQTHLTTLVKGTFGYLDPEYFQSSQFTEKSDVYSFGVVVVELLTGLKPICFSEEEQSHLNLAGLFLLALEENRVNGILDPQVKETTNEEELEAIIRLSQQCLNMNGRNRPSMKEIVMELQNIKKSQIPSTVSYENGDLVELELQRLGVVTSSHLTASSSDASPLMSSSF